MNRRAEALSIELALRQEAFKQQYGFNTEIKGRIVCGTGRIDLLFENRLIVELKAVDILLLIHQAQVISCLKTFNFPVGLLLNFNVPVLKSGIRRIGYTK